MKRNRDKNALSFWFPQISDIGIPVPETEIIQVENDLGLVAELVDLPDDIRSDYMWVGMEISRIARQRFGYPIFLRTGHLSAKHQWDKSCFVKSGADIRRAMFTLIETSQIAQICDPLPTDEWVVRRFIELETHFTAFEGMPVAKEFRVFIRPGEVVCRHPYWPIEALVDAPNITSPDWRYKWLNELTWLTKEDSDTINLYAQMVADTMDGNWSVDFAKALDGKWYLIDMADAAQSYHEKECEHMEEFENA